MYVVVVVQRGGGGEEEEDERGEKSDDKTDYLSMCLAFVLIANQFGKEPTKDHLKLG